MVGAHGSSCRTLIVVVDIKYISAQNVVIHTENCKLELLLDFSVTQVEKNTRRMCGIDESRRDAEDLQILPWKCFTSIS